MKKRSLINSENQEVTIKTIPSFQPEPFPYWDLGIINPNKIVDKPKTPYQNILFNENTVNPMREYMESEIFKETCWRKPQQFSRYINKPSPWTSSLSTKSKETKKCRVAESVEKPLFVSTESKIESIEDPPESDLDFSISDIDFSQR